MNGWHEELDRRCVGTNREGERCARAPIRGGTTCTLHGGASPNAQAAAKSRLLAMVEPVLGVFESILAIWHSTRCTGCGHVDENGVTCVGCGKPSGDPMPVIRVGQLVLDRAGFHPSLQLIAPAAPENPYEGLTAAQLADRAEEFARRARELANAVEAGAEHVQITDGVIDAGYEVPEDDIIAAEVDVPEGVEHQADDPNPTGIGPAENRTDDEEPASD